MEHKDDPSPDNLIQCSLHQDDEAEADPRIRQLELSENELHKLEIDLAMILAKRSHLIRRINFYRTSLAPCNKLPFELIGEIIMLTSPELQPLPLTNIRDDPRIHYTQICSHWRGAAFGVNQLWNNIDLERGHNNSPVNLIAAWLRQSSSTQIILKLSGLTESFDAEYLWKQVLVPYSQRLKSFDSMLTDPNHFHSLPFNTLETLSLLYGPCKINAGGSMMASSLQYFRVTEILPSHNFGLLSFLPSLPWEQLTSLSLNGSFSFGDIRRILLQCKLLEHCQLDAVECDSPSVHEDPVGLPRLKSLQIKFGSPHLFHELFSLVVPNLSTFTVNLPPSASEVLERFAQFMTTLKNTLHHLEITRNGRNFHGVECSIDEIMHMFPFVTHFVAKELSIGPATLARCGAGELLPNIKSLEFLARGDGRIEDIAYTLVPRQPGVWTSHLRDIYIHTDQRYCSGKRLKELHSQGVNVWAVYRYPHVPGVGPGGCNVGTWTLL